MGNNLHRQSRSGHTIRGCKDRRLGSPLPGYLDKETVGTPRIKDAHKYAKTFNSKTYHNDFVARVPKKYCRLRILSGTGLLRVETMPKNLFKEIFLYLNFHPKMNIPNLPSTQGLFDKEMGFTMSVNRCPLRTNESRSTISFTPFSLIKRTLKKIIAEEIILIPTTPTWQSQSR